MHIQFIITCNDLKSVIRNNIVHSTTSMNIRYTITPLVAAAVLAVCSAEGISAQGRRTVTFQTSGHGRASSEVEAYLPDAVDEQPQFPGGEIAMLHFINSERRYPVEAYQKQIQGRVLCGFIIGTDGAIDKIEVIRGVDEHLNKEAVRIIQNMPRWKAGKIGSSKVPVYFILPIPFRI